MYTLNIIDLQYYKEGAVNFNTCITNIKTIKNRHVTVFSIHVSYLKNAALYRKQTEIDFIWIYTVKIFSKIKIAFMDQILILSHQIQILSINFWNRLSMYHSNLLKNESFLPFFTTKLFCEFSLLHFVCVYTLREFFKHIYCIDSFWWGMILLLREKCYDGVL